MDIIQEDEKLLSPQTGQIQPSRMK